MLAEGKHDKCVVIIPSEKSHKCGSEILRCKAVREYEKVGEWHSRSPDNMCCEGATDGASSITSLFRQACSHCRLVRYLNLWERL